MTKMKSKKMTKSTFAIIIMAVAMVAMLAFGGTYAYFTAQTKTLTTGELTVGTVKLTTATENAATITATGTIVPGATLVKNNIVYTNEATVETIVAVVMTVKIDGAALTLDGEETVAGELAKVGVTLSTTADWADPIYDTTLGGFVYTLKSKTLADKTSAASVQFTNGDITFDANEHRTETEDGEDITAGKGGVDLDASIQGKKIEISITAYQAQLFYAADGKTLEKPADATEVIADLNTALAKKTAA